MLFLQFVPAASPNDPKQGIKIKSRCLHQLLTDTTGRSFLSSQQLGEVSAADTGLHCKAILREIPPCDVLL